MQRDSRRYFYRSTGMSFAIRITGIGLLFLANILTAHAMSPQEFGSYSLIVEIAALSAVLASLGLDQLAVRIIPDLALEGSVAAMWRFTLTGLALVSFSGLILWIGLMGLHRAHLLSASLTLPIIHSAALLTAALGGVRVCQEILRARRQIVASQLGEQLVWPLSLAVLAVLALVGTLPLNASVIASRQVLIYVCLIACLVFLLSRTMPAEQNAGRPPIGNSSLNWLAMSVPLAVAGTISVFLNRGDIIALGLHVSPADLAPYAAASRYAALMVLGQAAASATTASIMREAWASGDRVALQDCVDRASFLSAAFAAPAFAIFLIIPGPLLNLFGPHYETGAHVLRILAFGQLFNAVSGPVALLVVVCDLQRVYVAAMAGCAIVMLTALAVLVPLFESTGAALAMVCSLSLLNVALALAVKRRTGVIAWVRPAGLIHAAKDFSLLIQRWTHATGPTNV